MLIDTHCHLNFSVFDENRDTIIQKGLQSGFEFIIIGTNFFTSQKAVEISQKYSQGVYSSVGLHPIDLDTGLVKLKPDPWEGDHFEKSFDYNKYKSLAQSKNVVAIGEIGLDYYRKPKTTKRKGLFKEAQKNLLKEELKLAQELNLPVIFHCRMAHEDLLTILGDNDVRPSKAVVHSFVGTQEELKQYLALGFYVGFNGVIFKNIEGISFSELIKFTPLDRILLETDSPYLKPPQMEGEINTPFGVKFVAEKIAQIKDISLDKVAEKTTENAKLLFNI